MKDIKKHLFGSLNNTRDMSIRHFIASHNLQSHPLVKTKQKLRVKYYAVLEYFIKECSVNLEYTSLRLAQYRTLLLGNSSTLALNESNKNRIIRSIVNDSLKPWRWKYRYWLLCDISLILLDEKEIKITVELIKKHLGRNHNLLIDELYEKMFCDDMIPSKMFFATSFIEQIRTNHKFMAQQEIRILITANMSAGKSTLINALVGKPITRTSQEACTANLCFVYNKPFEDGAVHFMSSQLNLNADCNVINKDVRTEVEYLASYFRSLIQLPFRVCIIDTPGVNSATNVNHGKLTHKALINEQYHKLIYVLNANKLGTDEEMRHLKHISENVPKDKVIFVLNKLDDFRDADDSILASIEGIKRDLFKLGFENPIICPLSAYFALLIKKQQNGEMLTEDEQDEYKLYVKKFSKPGYDLSLYYNETEQNENIDKNEFIILSKKCGIYGFENILLGGHKK